MPPLEEEIAESRASTLSLPQIASGPAPGDGKLLGRGRFDCMGQPIEVALRESAPG